jgi:hypothetical protein
VDDSLLFTWQEPTPYGTQKEEQPTVEDDRSQFPRNWHRRNQFVAPSGNVYLKGVLAPELFGTLPIDEN